MSNLVDKNTAQIRVGAHIRNELKVLAAQKQLTIKALIEQVLAQSLGKSNKGEK